MKIIGALLAGLALVGILGAVWRGRVPRGDQHFGSERNAVWLGAATVYAVGAAYVLGWWWAAPAIAVLGAAGVARTVAKRWDKTALVAAGGGLAFALLCVAPLGWFGVAVGVIALVAIGLLARKKLCVADGRSERAAVVIPLAAAGGLLAGLPYHSAGLLACGLAAAALVAYVFAIGLRSRGPMLALLIAVGLPAGPVIVWIELDRPDGELWLIAATTLLLVGAAMGLYREAIGPFDDQIDMVHPFVGTVVKWAWVGRVSPTEATITARLADGVHIGDADIAATPPAESQIIDDVHSRAPLRVKLRKLPEGQPCTVVLKSAAGGKKPATIKFTTFPTKERTITIAAGSCASTGSQAHVFDRIRRRKPDVFLQIGDLHYENIEVEDEAAFHDAYDRALASPPLAALFREVPTVHIIDDHDFGPNNSDHDSPSRVQSLAAYREVEPSYVPPASTDAINQQFRIGPVQVLLTDTRSDREPLKKTKAKPGEQHHGRKIMRPEQQKWLVGQVQAAKRDTDCKLVVWACSTPWIGFGNDPDIWEGFPGQRHEIYDQLRAIGQKLVFVSGDAHMIGIDDGTNSAPVRDGHGFPVLAAASLDRRPSQKGGPPSLGWRRITAKHRSFWTYEGQNGKKNPQPGFGQYATITVDPADEGDLTVTLETHDKTGVVHSYVVDFDKWLQGAAVGPPSGPHPDQPPAPH